MGLAALGPPGTWRDRQGSTTAVLGTLRALGNVRALVFGQYGEASADVHSLLRAAAKSAAASAGRQSGAPSGALRSPGRACLPDLGLARP
eukprot:scaffold873_cov111-Isochrysis_galbana.AAC.1